MTNSILRGQSLLLISNCVNNSLIHHYNKEASPQSLLKQFTLTVYATIVFASNMHNEQN